MLDLTTHEASWSLSYTSQEFNNQYVLVESFEVLDDDDYGMFESDEIVLINNIPHTVMHHIIYLDSDHILKFHTPTSQVSHTEFYFPKYVTPEIHQQVLNYFNF